MASIRQYLERWGWLEKLVAWWESLKPTPSPPPEPKPTPLPLPGARVPLPITKGKTQVWYGCVNDWAAQGWPALKRELEECVRHGVAGYHIEMAGWADTTGYRKPGHQSEIEEMYNRLVEFCRAYGLWCFVSICNDNAGHGKYGDSGPPLADQRDYISGLIECVRTNGPKNVIVQPVGETQTSAGREIENECRQKLGQFTLVNNRGSRPTSAEGMDYFAYHPWTTGDKVPNDAIVVSDTGRIIGELCYGFDPTGEGKVDTTRRWVENVTRQGCPVVCFYHFKFEGFDPDIIKALGDAAEFKQRSEPEPTPEPIPKPDVELVWDKGGERPASGCRTVGELTKVVMKSRAIDYVVRGCGHWRRRPSEKNTQCYVCLFVLEDDRRYHGGKFEWGWSTDGKHSRRCHNLKDYKGWDGYPERGALCAFCLLSQSDRKERSPVVTGTWQG